MSTATSPDARRGHPDDPEGAPHPPTRPVRGVGAVLLVGGLVGGLTAVVLLLEKLALLADPAYVPSCSIDPVLSCGTIMRTAQATAFGFPNPLIGVATFPVVATVGALVLSGVALPRWTWLSLQFGSMAGLGFVLWLMGESLLVIHALCPYCMVVWVVVIAVCWAVTVHNMDVGHLGGGPVAAALVRRRGVVLTLALLALAVAVFLAFPDYWVSAVGLGTAVLPGA